MMNSIYKRIIIAALLFAQGVLVVSAASITVNSKSRQVHAGDVIVIDVFLNTEGAAINTVDGAITLSATGQLQVRDISTAGSAVSLWPRKPSLSESGNKISFVGGIPGGVSENQVPLFKVVILAEKTGTVTVSPTGSAYLNDGKGTLVPIAAQISTIELLPPREVAINEWENTFKKDITLPEPFTITQYQDDQLYNGNTFISFGTTDRDSGVSHYEVREAGRLPVRSGDQYVLINQNTYQKVSVSAIDYAGNIRTVTDTVGKRPLGWMTIIIGVILVSLIIKRKMVLAIIKHYVHKKNKQ
jgi:hypothetical protein